MALVTTTDPRRVAALCDEVIARDPVGQNIFGTIAAAVRADDGDGWAAHPEGDPLVLTARSQPHSPVTCTSDWADAAALADVLAALDPPPASFAGPPATVEAVCARLPWPVSERMDERLHRLDELRPPAPVEGSARLGVLADASWLAGWYTDFFLEAFGSLFPGFDAQRMVADGVVTSRCWIWCDADAQPVSYAVRRPSVCGVSRLGPVYTPPRFRGRGFGSAATAAASRDVLDDGDVACLFTDLANPTSNKIYAALGYRPVADRTFARF